jgi:hypothetical protein
VAAARSSNAGRKPSEVIRSIQETFRQYAFDEGIKVMRTAGTGRPIDRVKIRDLLDSFRELHPGTPPSLKSVILRPQWLEAVRENDISRLVLTRTVSEVKTVHTIEEKLECRPDMKYLFDWCLEWMQSECAQNRAPTFARMEEEWVQRSAQREPFFQQRGPRYAKLPPGYMGPAIGV